MLFRSADYVFYVRQNQGWVAANTMFSAGANASGYNSANFIDDHYPYEIAINVNGTTYYVPART